MDIHLLIYGIVVVIPSFLIGYWFGKKRHLENQKKGELQSKIKIAKSLLSELQMNENMLSLGLTEEKDLNGKKFEWFSQPLYFDSYESVKSSGKLILLKPDIQSALRITYERLKNLEKARSDKEVLLLPKVYVEAVELMGKYIIALKDSIPLISEALEIEISALHQPNSRRDYKNNENNDVETR